MTKEKSEYLTNKARVYEIYGIKLHDPNYNCHHIIGKAEAVETMGRDFNVNQKSNLIPLLKEVHEELHQRENLCDLELPTVRSCKLPKKRKHHGCRHR